MPANLQVHFVQRYFVARILISLGVLGWLIGVLGISGAQADTVDPQLKFVAIALGVQALALLWARRHEPTRAFMLLQLALDAGGVSVLSAMSGDVHSIFTLLYFPPIAAGAAFLGREGALWGGTFSSLGFAVALVLRHDLHTSDVEGAVLTYTEAMFRVFAFFLMALLTGQLGERVARAGQALQEERRTSQALASEHDTVLDRVRAGVLTSDVGGTIVSLNPFARALLGDVRGQLLTDVFPQAETSRSWEESRADGQRWVCTLAWLPEGGRVMVVDDVTELAHARETAAHAERLAAVGRLAAGMAHEIRNPLASLSGSLQLIQEEHPSRLAELALGEAERLNRLVDDFLSAARKPVLTPVPLDFSVLARDVCEGFSRDPRYARRVRARCEGGPVDGLADPDRLRQALLNLLLNAAQAMPRGGEVLVTVRDAPATPERPDGAEILVADEGTGIPEGDRTRVFDPFYTTRNGGTGLGLVLVDQIIRGHGGTVSMTPREPLGTEFRVWLPKEVTVGE